VSYIIGFVGGIFGSLAIEFVKPFIKLFSVNRLKKFESNISYLNDIEQRLSNSKSCHEFYENKAELEKISGILKKFYTKKDNAELQSIQLKIYNQEIEYEKCSLEERVAFSINHIFGPKRIFLDAVLTRQKNNFKNRLITYFMRK